MEIPLLELIDYFQILSLVSSGSNLFRTFLIIYRYGYHYEDLVRQRYKVQHKYKIIRIGYFLIVNWSLFVPFRNPLKILH